MQMTGFYIFLIIGYLVGSINSAIIVSKLMKLPDPRQQGSKNPGATNVLRLSHSKLPAILVLVGDGLKGFLPVVVARLIGLDGLAAVLIGLAAVIGHMYPVFFKFQGGKGVATSLGVILGLSLLLGILCLIIWAAVAAIWRYSSLASLVAVAAAPVLNLFIGSQTYFLGLSILAIVVIVKHWPNIERLLDGNESKINF